jgi:hypothetical protein
MLTEAFASRFHGFRLCFYIADAYTKNSRSMNRSPDSCARYKASMRSLYNWHWIVFWCTRMSATLFGQRAAS